MSGGEMDFEHVTQPNIERWANTSELDTLFDARFVTKTATASKVA